MIIDIKGILSGIKNSVFVKAEVEKIAEQRINICKQCEHYSPNAIKAGAKISRKDAFCLDCSCNMYLKTRYLNARCPLGTENSKFPTEVSKWGPVIDDPQLTDEVLALPGIKEELDQYKIDLMNNKIEEHGN